MSSQKLSAFEKEIITGLAYKAGLAATIFDTWANLLEASVQRERSLIDMAQLGVTEECAVREILEKSVALGLLELTSSGFLPRKKMHNKFRCLALALNAIEHYVAAVHKDLTTVQVVLTKPPKPSILEHKLSELGWRTSELEPTDHAFKNMVISAQHRVVVMTPFFDTKGALWLQELFSLIQPGVERILILRSLENPMRKDYPNGYDIILPWLKSETIHVFNYSIPKVESSGRETFHAKVVLCDQKSAYLGSSNITAASLEQSMEMGVALQGRAAADVAVVLNAVINASVQWI